MFEFYVTKGYPLDKLLESTAIERIFLRDAMENYFKSIGDAFNTKEKSTPDNVWREFDKQK